MRHDPHGPAAILSPHLDDAVLSAWAPLTRLAGTRVVNICSQLPPSGPAPRWDRLTGATDAAERMRERLVEDTEALELAGVEPAVGLDFLDAHYRSGPIDPAALREAIEAAVPATSELWAPAGIGAHADHLQVRQAALELAAGGGPPVRLYAELPYAVKYGWPSWVTGHAGPRGLDLDAWLADYLPGDGGLPPAQPCELSEREAARKLAAAQCYGTQWHALRLSASVPLDDPRVLRYELSFAAPPAVPGQEHAAGTEARAP